MIATDLNEAKLADLASDSIQTHRMDATSADDIAATRPQSRAGWTSCSTVPASCHQGSILAATEEEWDFAFALNVRSMFRTIRAFLPAMLTERSGSIVNISSGASVHQGARPTGSSMARPRRR